MKVTLKKAVQKHYTETQLSTEKMALLKQIQGTNKVSTPKERFLSPKIWKSMVAVAAMFILFLPLGLGLLNKNSIQNEILSEVVYNHTRDMGLEIQTASFDSVKKYLSKLDFQLINSSFLPEDEWTVLGGRYCSIQGKLAALIQVQNKESGVICSFYQSKIPEGFDPDSQMVEKFLDGVNVKLWFEKGLLLAIVV